MAVSILDLPSTSDYEQAINSCAQIRLFGGFRIEREGRELTASAGSRRLLASLAISGRTTRSALAETLWPDATRERAQARLRTSLWRLAELGDLVETQGERLGLATDVEVDICSFSRQVSGLGPHPGLDEPALDLVVADAGELLPGWYDEWVLFERERLRQLRLRALETVAVSLCGQGQHAAAIEAALHAIRLEPFRESAHRILVTIHLREENFSEALRHFRLFRRLMREELGVEPSSCFGRLLEARCPEFSSPLDVNSVCPGLEEPAGPGGSRRSGLTCDQIVPSIAGCGSP